MGDHVRLFHVVLLLICKDYSIDNIIRKKPRLGKS